MKYIQIFGMGCPKCEKLAENAKAAAEALGIEYHLEKIKDANIMAGYGVMLTPAIAVDGQVKASGRLLTPDQIKDLLV